MKPSEQIKAALGLATALFISVPGVTRAAESELRMPLTGKRATRIRATQRKDSSHAIGSGDPRVGRTIGDGGDPRVGNTIGGGGDPRVTGGQRRVHDSIREEKATQKLQQGTGLIVK